MKDVIIVGGGLTGMLAARILHRAGLSVMLVEQGELGREASWTNSGVLSALYPWRASETFNQWSQYGQQYYPQLCAELKQQTGLEPELLRSGMLVLDNSRQEHEKVRAWNKHYQQAVSIESVAAVRELEPHLAALSEQAVFLSQVQQIRNPKLVRAIAASLRQQRILISEHQAVKSLKIKKGRVSGIKLQDTTFKANKVILATGAWTHKFREMEALLGKQKVFREHIILFRGAPGLLKHIIVKDGHYLVPRRDGRIICGAIRSQGKSRPADTEAAVKQLCDFAYALMPVLKHLPLRNHWTGRYTKNPDSLPQVGKHPELAGLYYNIGHGNEGMVTGPASVQKLVDLVLEQASGLPG